MSSSLDHDALASLLRRPHLRSLLAAMNQDGEETRIVGGAIRNALLGRPVTEVDCTTTALPDQIVRLSAQAGFKSVPTGIEHGTITVIVGGEPFEVTTLREDVETDGRYAVVRFGRDFAADARRRDFTINALSLGLDGRLHDHTGGLADLAARRVRFIGDAHVRIREDYLRILRFFRFFAEYAEADPDPDGLAAAGQERAGLAILSRERIRHEVLRLLGARRAVDTVRILAEHGFLTWILDGAGEFGRLRRSIGAGQPFEPVERLAALAVMVEEDADRLRERLRLSNEEHRKLSAYGRLVACLKSGPDICGAVDLRRLVAVHGIDMVLLGMAALAGEPRPRVSREAMAALDALRSGVAPLPVFPLRGADLVEKGVPKGPRIGELLSRARTIWIAEGCPDHPGSATALLQRVLADG
ncbi:CCA tRNA nucleotidyltransferase [Microvirga rosea]|uniref:CCA tRNA nucleotidyltransferase n=1 Tax=Microvirga rosea TaxID=2715425 RepID=UPI001D09F807|nr:CCA tRNA nucleotidyltransferase [Microvirga rosea]MCB8821615.1 CCA tRNA nucleotidyltransferase [Microvirga rosea]